VLLDFDFLLDQNFKMIQVEVLDAKSQKVLASYNGVGKTQTITDLKDLFVKSKPQYYPDRQSFRLEPRGRMLKDSDTFEGLGLTSGTARIYFKDLGPQIGWTTVFLSEYLGPLAMYALFYARPWFIYGEEARNAKMHWVVHLAMGCYCTHYVKRVLETIFVHRFSHATMPIMNLFKNCSYYWGFSAWISYYVNHPLYTPPSYGDRQIWGAFAAWVVFELGNFSIHWALRNLRPPGTKERRIPYPAASNPLTFLFKYVSCPNYTYEVYGWIAFTIMTQSLPAGLFALAGLYQMTVWALGKHRNYKKEFSNYPRGRRAILPFII
jgi:very-long-chain enoyl-CoA reductase